MRTYVTAAYVTLQLLMSQCAQQAQPVVQLTWSARESEACTRTAEGAQTVPGKVVKQGNTVVEVQKLNKGRFLAESSFAKLSGATLPKFNYPAAQQRAESCSISARHFQLIASNIAAEHCSRPDFLSCLELFQ